MNFEASFTTAKSPAQALEAIKRALTEKKFSILFYFHVNEKLAEKGLSLAPDIHILEVCNAAAAKEAIETNPLVAYFIPCKIVIRQINGETTIGLVKPTTFIDMLTDKSAKDIAEKIENTLLEVLKTAR